MNRLLHTIHRRAFTLVEVLVAIAILGIVSSLVVINYTQSQRNARDGIRKADAPALLTAVEQYVQANGTSFITYPSSTTNNKPGVCTVSNTTDPSVDATSSTNSCVGASGRSYGLVNAVNTTLTGVGVSGSPNRDYTSHSIVQALQTEGYLNVAPKDPRNPVGLLDGTNAQNYPDYALIRACPNGQQHVATRGQLFAVWVMLENSLSANDLASLSRVVGETSAAPLNSDGTTSGYDFAAGKFQTTFQSNGYGVSNGTSQPNSVGLTCSANNNNV